MITEAIDTVWTLGWALLVWIVLLATVAGLIVYAVVITVWATVRGVVRVCRLLRARLRAELPPAGSQPHVPSRAEPGHHYSEAA